MVTGVHGPDKVKSPEEDTHSHTRSHFVIGDLVVAGWAERRQEKPRHGLLLSGVENLNSLSRMADRFLVLEANCDGLLELFCNQTRMTSERGAYYDDGVEWISICSTTATDLLVVTTMINGWTRTETLGKNQFGTL